MSRLEILAVKRTIDVAAQPSKKAKCQQDLRLRFDAKNIMQITQCGQLGPIRAYTIGTSADIRALLA